MVVLTPISRQRSSVIWVAMPYADGRGLSTLWARRAFLPGCEACQAKPPRRGFFGFNQTLVGVVQRFIMRLW